jgi:hypothetical protein
MPQLTYSADYEIAADVQTQSQALLNALIEVHGSSSPITVDVGAIRPIGSQWLLTATLSASGSLAELEALEGELAQTAVDMGLEPDVETAKAAIQVA